ncbi:MAG: DM13 domain-containing protein [Actinobacteria bacterium]|nr:DM13 domain-containing protein [Actinomycetota bacterium]
MKRFLSNYKLSVPLLAVVVGGLAWVAFGYFAIQTAFVDDEVNEALPSFEVAPVTNAPDTTVAVDQSPIPTSEATSAPTTQTPQAQIVTEASGTFVSREHHTSGSASVLGDGSGRRVLRIEDLDTSNGPDLNVYLVNSSTGDVSDFIDLGDLKGNIGDQNYEVPEGTDLTRYDTVVIWCVRFSSAFGDARLQPGAP